jgi:hypothetical protein
LDLQSSNLKGNIFYRQELQKAVNMSSPNECHTHRELADQHYRQSNNIHHYHSTLYKFLLNIQSPFHLQKRELGVHWDPADSSL